MLNLDIDNALLYYSQEIRIADFTNPVTYRFPQPTLISLP